jgi:hypothetical protein
MMAMDITRRKHRRQEIITELECASHYFELISAEIDIDQIFLLPVIEQKIAQRIYENILYLQWRLEALKQINH